MCSILSGIGLFIHNYVIYSQYRHCRRAVGTPTGLNEQTTFFAGFSMKAAELKVPKPYSKESMSNGTF